MLTVTVTDGTHDLTLAFFKPLRPRGARWCPGAPALFAGKVQRYRSTLAAGPPATTSCSTPRTPTPRSGSTPGASIPVYLHVPKLDSWAITKCGADRLRPPRRGRRPGAGRGAPRSGGWYRLLEAYRLVHLPKDRAEVRRGEHRLRYDEAFTVQAMLAQRRRANADVRTTARRPRPGGLLEAFDERLPFELTAGQVAVERADRRRAGAGAPDAPAAAGRGRLGQDHRRAAGDARGHRLRRAGRAAGAHGGPCGAAPPVDHAPCSATSPRAACSAAATSAPGWRC